MAKRKIEEVVLEAMNGNPLTIIKLYNETKKHKFQLEYKHGFIYVSITRKNSKDFNKGVVKFTSIDEIKKDARINQYLNLVNIDDFFNNFKYQ